MTPEYQVRYTCYVGNGPHADERITVSMTVSELIERLSDYDDDAEVRIAIQPHYPLQSHIAGVCSKSEAVNVDGDEEEVAEMEAKDQDGEKIVYIAEAGQVYDEPYAMRSIWEATYS